MISLETTDLFRGAFLLCMGARFDRVRVRNNGRRIATFLITGKDLDRLDCGGWHRQELPVLRSNKRFFHNQAK